MQLKKPTGSQPPIDRGIDGTWTRVVKEGLDHATQKWPFLNSWNWKNKNDNIYCEKRT